MAASDENVVCIVPETSVLLDTRSRFPCSVEGCGKVLSNYGALRLHLVKTHKLYQNDGDRALGLGVRTVDTMKYVYHCPVQTCVYFCDQDGKNRPFTSMKNLKQHYQKVHADKNFKCDKCERGFGLERDKRRHEKTCGLLIKCLTCGCPYSTKEALMTHCKRKEHEIPEEWRGKNAKQKSSDDGEETKAAPNIIIINIVQMLGSNTPIVHETPSKEYRPILPKPVFGRTIPLTTVTMTSGRVLVEHQEVLEKQNVNTQTESALVEQGTCTAATDVTSTAVQAGTGNVGRMGGYGNRDFGTSMTVHTGVMTGHQHHQVHNQLSHLGRYDLNSEPGFMATDSPGSLTHAHSQSTGLSLTRTGHAENLFNPINTNSQPTICSLSNNSALVPQGFVLSTASMYSSKGMQTFVSLPPKKRKQLSIAVAETQTPGDYILKSAMASAQISLHRKSKGSQVSPRAKVKGRRNVVPVHVSTQSGLNVPGILSCESPLKSPRKKKRRKSSLRDKKTVLSISTGQSNQLYQPLCEQLVSASTQFSQNLQLVRNSSCVTGGTDGNVSRHRTATTTPAVRTTTGTSTEMVLDDGPHTEDHQVGTTAEFDDMADHQTQTVGILEELDSLASTTSTQTQNSFLAQPNNAGIVPETANIQHSETQTFMSAFTADVSSIQSNPSEFSSAGTSSSNTVFRNKMQDNLRLPESLPAVMDDFDFVHHNSHDPPMNSTCQSSRTNDFPVTFENSHIQTTATDLLNLLDMGIQADSGPGTTIQTQTDVDEMWELFCHNIETQTSDDLFLQDLEFSDIQIQTNLDLEMIDNSSTVETQTTWHSVAAGGSLSIEQSDMQTQTRFSGITLDSALTNSHTQTPWDDITSLIFQDL